MEVLCDALCKRMPQPQLQQRGHVVGVSETIHLVTVYLNPQPCFAAATAAYLYKADENHSVDGDGLLSHVTYN